MNTKSAYLTYVEDQRSPLSAQSNLRARIEAENYVSQITVHLIKLTGTLSDIKERTEHQQDLSKAQMIEPASMTSSKLEIWY